MKEIFKVLPAEYNMKYDEVFNGPENKRIRQKLVPELLRSLRLRYNPSYSKLKEWLRALHKHRRDDYLLGQKGGRDQANRRVHNNNRISEV
jgi:CRISPR/Cas system-associated protein Cas10 (large subunit of type III CRISPR-Cas system)